MFSFVSDNDVESGNVFVSYICNHFGRLFNIHICKYGNCLISEVFSCCLKRDRT